MTSEGQVERQQSPPRSEVMAGSEAPLKGAVWGSPKEPGAEGSALVSCLLICLSNPNPWGPEGPGGQRAAPFLGITQEKPPQHGGPLCSRGSLGQPVLAPCSAKAHLGHLDHGLAKLFYLVLTVQDVPEVLMSPVLKQESGHLGDRPTQRL